MAREWDTKTCRGENCDEQIVFLRTKKNFLVPINVVPHDKKFREVDRDDHKYIHGEHEPHHSTCPDVDRFRRRK